MTPTATILSTILEERLRRLIQRNEREAARVLAAVCDTRGIAPSRLLSPVKTPYVSDTRAIGAYLLRSMTDLSFPAIGRILGRDHTTVITAVERVTARPELLDEAMSIAWGLETGGMERELRACA